MRLGDPAARARDRWACAARRSPGIAGPRRRDPSRSARHQGTEHRLFAVTWKVPKRGDRVVPLTPRLPESLELVGSPSAQDVPGARVERATYKNNAAR